MVEYSYTHVFNLQSTRRIRSVFCTSPRVTMGLDTIPDNSLIGVSMTVFPSSLIMRSFVTNRTRREGCLLANKALRAIPVKVTTTSYGESLKLQVNP